MELISPGARRLEEIHHSPSPWGIQSSLTTGGKVPLSVSQSWTSSLPKQNHTWCKHNARGVIQPFLKTATCRKHSSHFQGQGSILQGRAGRDTAYNKGLSLLLLPRSRPNLHLKFWKRIRSLKNKTASGRLQSWNNCMCVWERRTPPRESSNNCSLLVCFFLSLFP